MEFNKFWLLEGVVMVFMVIVVYKMVDIVMFRLYVINKIKIEII